MIFRGILACCFVSLAFCIHLHAQTTIKGTIKDQETGESIVGAHVMLKYTSMGTLTDPDGFFVMNISLNPPFTLVVSALGYNPEEIRILESGKNIDLSLTPKADSTFGVVASAPKVEDMVVSASKFEERINEAPVTTHKLGLLSIRELPNIEAYAGLNFLPEVQANPSSFSFVSINTRGFADAQNWRFVNLVDGVDISAPGLNYSVGGLSAGSELDLSHIELVSGPGSALYGPNVFNGVMVMNTKSPFDYQGISAHVKGGFTVQKAGGSHPYGDVAVRVARKMSDKFALKLNLNYQNGTDWAADDQSFHISNTNFFLKDSLLALPRNHPNYDAVSVFGDEVQVPIDLGDGTPVPINRSGIHERDIIDYGISNIKLGVAAHYRITDKIEAIYDYRFAQGDAILRHTTTYPFRHIRHQIQKLELRSPDFYVRAYLSSEDANKSYSMLATGAFIQEGLKPSNLWARDYGMAFRGEIPGIKPGDHDAARAFADRDIPGPETELFQTLRNMTLENPDIRTGGSKFIERSSLIHVEGNYDLASKVKVVEMQVGGSFRRYRLNSDGQLFNDGPLGFDSKIPINEFGLYGQATKKLLKDRLILRGSIRWDKNQNFQARFTPRTAMILSLGKQRQHHFRLTAQTGFRNPASQETYIALDLGEAVILGGTKDNISHYNFDPGNGNLINGLEIYNQLYTIPSVQAFLATGGTDPSLLMPANLSFLKQERISTIEFGYKTVVDDHFKVGVNVYRNVYKDLVSRIVAYSLKVLKPYAIYTNISDEITSSGISLEASYQLPQGYEIGGNYSHITFNADDAVANNPGFLPSFNTPQNRFNLMLSNRNVTKGVGFFMVYRWSGAYLWQSPFGQGEVAASGQLDAAVNINIPNIRGMFKIGGTNIFGKEYRPIYGGPNIGSVYYIGFTIDEIKWK